MEEFKGIYLDTKQIVSDLLNFGLTPEQAQNVADLVSRNLPLKVFTKAIDVEFGGGIRVRCPHPATPETQTPYLWNFLVEAKGIDPLSIKEIEIPKFSFESKELPYINLKVDATGIAGVIRKLGDKLQQNETSRK